MRNKLNQIKPSIAFAWALLTCTIAFGHGLSWYESILPDLYTVNRVLAKQSQEPQEAHSEVLDSDEVEYTYENNVSIHIAETGEGKIKRKIKEVFGEEAENATKIAECESQLNPNAHGDKHLTYEVDGVTYGDSIGLMQIRTFVNRPDRELLKDPDFNLKYAKKMFDAQGWSPWTCARQVGLIK